MPTDPHGQSHTGNRGLFDDDAEHDDAVARAEQHEREHLEGVLRRHERHEKRQLRKDQKAAQRATQGKSRLPKAVTWAAKLFGGGKDRGLDAAPVPGGVEEGGSEERSPAPERRREYVIVRKPPTPEPVYTAEDVDPVESLWLRECGMVRVRSDDPGGCHIVPRSVVQGKE